MKKSHKWHIFRNRDREMSTTFTHTSLCHQAHWIISRIKEQTYLIARGHVTTVLHHLYHLHINCFLAIPVTICTRWTL